MLLTMLATTMAIAPPPAALNSLERVIAVSFLLWSERICATCGAQLPAPRAGGAAVPCAVPNAE
jgi:hypothetical protein